MEFKKIGIIASKSKEAKSALRKLVKLYNFIEIEEFENQVVADNLDLILALGGDGFMLHMLHNFMESSTPIYGMNRGTVGFLMNEYHEKDLIERLNEAKKTIIHPLVMRATDIEGTIFEARAINEVSLLRTTSQAAKLKISIDKKIHMEQLISDGVLIATPAGSSAYNLSAGGPILPLQSKLLALTPINAFRPRRWKGALLPQNVEVNIEVTRPQNRPVHAVADFHEVPDVVKVSIKEDKKLKISLLFDPGHGLEERIIREQFES